MNPEQARRLIANCKSKQLISFSPQPQPEPKRKRKNKRYNVKQHGILYTTAYIAYELGILPASVNEILTRKGFKSIKLISPDGRLSNYWRPEVILNFKTNELRSTLPNQVDWITAKEAMQILKCSRTWLYRHANSVHRFVNGRTICYYDKTQILKLK